MMQTSSYSNRKRRRLLSAFLKTSALATVLCGLPLVLCAQTFNSGSTGALGAFNPTQDITVTLPDDGILNYTTVNIPSDVSVFFQRNAKNTPVIILASGDVTIAGKIFVSGGGAFDNARYYPSNGTGLNGKPIGAPGGPGGFRSGGGGVRNAGFLDGVSGDGPGGGGAGKSSPNGATAAAGGGAGFLRKGEDATGVYAAGAGQGGSHYGSFRLLPLVGGSGGGGSAVLNQSDGGGGGGGGGAILIASSGKITLQSSGLIFADGGLGQVVASGGSGGGGAGGAIRLIATMITGSGRLSVYGGCYKPEGSSLISVCGSPGYVRAETYNFTDFNPNLTPTESYTFGLPTTVTPANLPQLRITSVAGANTPTAPKGSFSAPPDLVLPSSQTNPVTVGLAGVNVPTGTIVNVTVTPETGKPVTVQSTALAGTNDASTATASVNLTPGYNLIHATASIDLPLSASNSAPLYIDGERVKRIEIAATSGGKASTTFITESGKRITPLPE